MKRAQALVPLSREHHEALVLARRACEPERPHAEPAALRLHVLRRWHDHFEPHFATEEQVLLPALAAAGANDDVQRALREHATLRAHVERLREGHLAALPAWGTALHEHVKWEERHLFPLAEKLLDLPALQAHLLRNETGDES